MKAVPETFELETMLAESEWVGGLALGLVGDSHQAEDITQEVWLAALRRPPGRHESARPWMATVARNAAKFLGRSEGARRERERDQAHETSKQVSASAEELASRLESQELVSRLVRELPAELSETIMLSFFEGLSSEEIAQRQGIPAGTVRWRKKRALEVLRERLDAHTGGDRSAWMSALTPLATTWSRRSAKATTSGGVLTATLTTWLGMATTSKTVPILAALLLAMLAIERRNAKEPTLAEGSSELSAQTQEPVSIPDSEPLSMPIEDPVVLRQPLGGTEPKPADEQAALITRVRLRVVNAQGSPIAGAVVKAVPSLALSQAHREVIEQLGPMLQASLVRTTTGSGEASWEIDFLHESGQVDFEVTGPNFSTGSVSAFIEAGADADLGEAVLESAGRLSGRVTTTGEEAPGRLFIELGPAALPKTEAGLSNLRRSGTPDSNYSSTSNKLGSFHFDGVAPGEYRAYIDPIISGDCTWSEPFVVVAGQSTDGVEIALGSEQPAKAEVLVLGSDGEPLRTARVHVSAGKRSQMSIVNNTGLWHFGSSYPSYAGGRIEVTDSSLRHRRGVIDPLPLAPGRIVVRMQPAATVMRILRITNMAGEVLDEADVSVAGPHGARHLEGYDGESALLLPDSSEGSFDLEVSASGHRTLELEGLLAGSLPEDWTVVLEELPGISGRVLYEGQPVSRAKIAVHWRTRVGAIKTKGNLVSRLAGSSDSIRTDKHGNFLVPHERDGDLVLIISASGRASAFVELPAYQASEGRADLVVELDKGGEVLGTVRDHMGVPVPNAAVVMNHPLLGVLQKTANRDGEFRFRRVSAGDWYLRLVPDLDSGFTSFNRKTPEDWQYPQNCTVVAGATQRHDLTLTDPESSKMTGRFSTSGVDIGQLTLEVEADSGTVFSGDPFAESWQATRKLGPLGNFDLPVRAGRDYDLTLTSPELAGSLRRSVTAHELPLHLEATFAFSTLHVSQDRKLAAGQSIERIAVRWSSDEWSYYQWLAPDVDGQLPPAIVPAGTVEVLWKTEADAEFQELKLEVTTGEESTLELP